MHRAIGVGATLTLVLLIGCWLPFDVVLRSFIIDDAFYYAKIARVFVQKGYFSFDGINETNGFHPLWMLVLLPIAWAVEDAELFIRVMLSVAAVFAGGGMGIAWRLLEVGASRANVALTWLLLVLMYQASWILLSGVEGSLALFLLYGSLAAYSRFSEEPSRRNLNSLSLWLNGLTLARLDTGALVGGVVLEHLIRGRGDFSARVQRAFRLGLQSAFLPTAYFAVNWLYYGHPLPVSAVVKTGHTISENLQRFTGALGRMIAFVPSWLWLVALLGGIVGLFWLYRQGNFRWQFLTGPGQIVLFSAAIVHFFWVGVFRGVLDSWYLLLEITAVGWGLVFLAEALQQKRQGLQWAFWAAVWAIGGVFLSRILYIHFAPKHREFKIAYYEAAQWIRKYLPPDARIGCFDSGLVGYFADRAVINLDGVVNTLHYVPYILGDSVQKYLEKHHIPYLAQGIVEGRTFTDAYGFSPELLGDTLYQRSFFYSTSGIHFGLAQARAHFLIVRLNVRPDS